MKTKSDPELDGGSASSTTGGTKNIWSLTRAVQLNDALTVPEELEPDMVTYPGGLPPVQCTVTPLARLTLVMLD